jgi:short-subunit dehydrogenase
MHIFLTGASSGIGRALALGLARPGTQLILCARRAALLEELAAEVRARGAGAETLALDVGRTDDLVAAMRAADDVRPIDMVIANAGAGPPRDADPLSWEAMAASCTTSFLGAAATVTAILPRMVARRAGHVVGISSLSAIGGPLPRAAPYVASKAGLTMLLDCLRLDVAPSGVAITAVHPGFVDTDMTRGADHPLPFLWTAERAADVILARLPARPARIDFPAPLLWTIRAAGLLPRGLYERIVRASRRAT